jgi:hypothetical protein
MDEQPIIELTVDGEKARARATILYADGRRAQIEVAPGQIIEVMPGETVEDIEISEVSAS